MNKRTIMLSKIIEKQELQKIAQDATVEGEVDEVTADKMAHDIFDKLFDDELKKLIGQS